MSLHHAVGICTLAGAYRCKAASRVMSHHVSREWNVAADDYHSHDHVYESLHNSTAEHW